MRRPRCFKSKRMESVKDMANYPYDEVGTKLDRTFAATLNKNFDEIEDDIRNLVETVGPILDDSFDSAALAAEFEERLNNEIQKLQPDWVEFKQNTTAQLAQIEQEKANRFEVFLKDNGININDFDEPTRRAFLEAQGINVDYVLGEGNVKPINTSFFLEGKNKLDYSRTVSGSYVNQDTGAFEVNASHRRTEKIKVEQGSYVFSYRNKETGANIANNVGFRHVFYKGDGNFIKGGLNETTLTVPAAATELVVSWTQANDAHYNIQLEKGTVVTSFEPYATQIPQSYLNLGDVQKEVEELRKELDNVSSDFKPTNILFSEQFRSNTPTYLTNSGGFTINNGLFSPAVAGYDKQIYYNKEVSLDKEKIYVDFIPTTENTIIGIGFRSAIAGLLCEVNFAANKLIIRNAWSAPNSTTPPTVFLEKSLTFNPVLNRKYSIVVEKDTRKNVSISITDSSTLETVKLDCVEQGTTSPSNAWGGAAIVAIAGQFKVSKFTFLSDQPSDPVLAIYSDSFGEGTTLVPNVEGRYAAKIKTALGGDCIIGAKGGETTGMLVSKISTYSQFRPQYTLLAVGLNDTVFSAYQANIETLIQWCESIGSIPILTTITRNMSVDNLSFMRQVNAYVKSRGYLYVDFATALSLNHDGETQNSSLFLSDKVHPNLDGHDDMFYKFVADVPEVFDIA